MSDIKTEGFLQPSCCCVHEQFVFKNTAQLLCLGVFRVSTHLHIMHTVLSLFHAACGRGGCSRSLFTRSILWYVPQHGARQQSQPR